MDSVAESRISVLRENRVVPLIPSARKRSDIKQPWTGILLEQHTVPAIEIPHHAHRDLCLHLQVTGASDFEWWSNGRHAVEKTAPGSLILLPPGTEDSLRWQGSSERIILSLRPDLLQDLADELIEGRAAEFESRWSLHDSSLHQLVLEMGRETADDFPLGGLYADLLGTGLASQLLRRHATNPAIIPSAKGGLPMPRLRYAMEYITANLHRNVRLEEIAAQLNLSPFHFAREFRSSTGQTPYQYLLDQRMDQAKYLLRNHHWSIQEIATMTGFNSPVNFIRTFRQRIGEPPGLWRLHR